MIFLKKVERDEKADFIYGVFSPIQCFDVQAKLYKRSLENKDLRA